MYVNINNRFDYYDKYFRRSDGNFRNLFQIYFLCDRNKQAEANELHKDKRREIASECFLT